ncbi:DeoR C terminal sensor domain-containing protein [Motilibacter peucedani]|uniref:DeoR C terminal sensor domain-containing protein n=1 Tax=Motilibacter peucedani TaxID=598650 RepID=A0A420XK09_9ACTN|nr:hypothetical protein [Motilibacter peucedani]RKS68481.1 DeoR C terminal sensor domain-containing protein [Motilibacter peucedani]
MNTTTSSRLAAAREALAARAAGVVRPGAVVGVSPGAVAPAVARRLARVPGVTIVTTSVRVARAVEQHHPRVRLVVTGGHCTPSGALVGPLALAGLSALQLDVAFVGVDGIDAHTGLAVRELLVADTSRAMMAAADRVVAVAERAAWGAAGLRRFAGLDQVDDVVTDAVERRTPLRPAVGWAP